MNCPLRKKHPVLLLHNIINGKPINNSPGARATGLELLCLLEPPFKCKEALQSHIQLCHAGPRDKTVAVKCEGDKCETPAIAGTGSSWEHCWKHWDGGTRLCSCNAWAWPRLSERTQGLYGGGEERWGEPSLKSKQRRPSAFNLSHILPFWPLHSFPKELSDPYSSTSTHKAPEWTETWPVSSRNKEQKKN